MSESAAHYRVTITASVGRGRLRKLRSCDLIDPTAVDVMHRWQVWRGWRREQQVRGQSLGARLSAASQTKSPIRWDRDTPEGSVFDLPEGITNGLLIPKRTLFTICDALHADNRTAIDVDDLKRIVSQQGARLAELHLLAEPARRHATEALYHQIAKALY
ncbi:hypothetical protein BST27_17095 [Mycobacterium intermedium]|uniref:Uncharacterized protein n=1 Tax=Mycobacterium intermedium TaxID=28445 RepID=A0A1E3SE33_MYCIE|nr:hypothetical protein [Mycobacterium intermedium]MCV6965926.1 hypothetical protein [Mycobacterium intermedium]ODR00391.1 hypothetical protein BHQ20_13665 [Mycobacterium intermedium]OPE51096.1 hypothetical protein BV508_08030 [Mycobacterium intermedium]ORB01731.1 hypothetical protein BST27_17095 [Mycobacterium intermedium]